MALVTVGNTFVGSLAYDAQNPQYDCEQPGPYDGIEITHCFSKGSFEKKITVYYYNHYPCHPNFIKNNGEYTENIVPFVQYNYENLDVNPRYLIVKGKPSGWYSMEITLSRDIKPGEYIKIGFHSKRYYSRYENRNGKTDFFTAFYPYGTAGVSDPLEAVRNGKFFQHKGRPMYSSLTRDYSFYFTYYDSPLPRNYRTDVTSKYFIVSKNNRISTFLRPYVSIVSARSKKQNRRNIKRSSTSCCNLCENIQAALLIIRSIFYKKNITSSMVKESVFKRNSVSSFNFFDSVKSLLTIICSVASFCNVTVIPGRIISYFRLQVQKLKNKSVVIHEGKFYRDSFSVSNTVSKVISSRALKRVSYSIASFWDFLRGKIRETPNVISLFCPVDLEVEIDCKI